MKIISFFLASSINDVAYDRLAIGDFINQLNNIYAPQDLFIRLYKCESDDLAHTIDVDGSQCALDGLIKDSDLCFVLFFQKAGEITLHELHVALANFYANDKPKIVVYFKKIPSGSEMPEEIKKVMAIIDGELLHYHREYDHVDSLKLGIITQLQVQGFVKADLKVENSAVVSAETPLFATDRIPMFMANSEYQTLMGEYQQAVAKWEGLQRQFSADSTSLALAHELSKASKEKERLKDDLAELSRNILDLGNAIAGLSGKHDGGSERIRKAVLLFDQGDYEGVLNLLDLADIAKGIFQLDPIEERVIKEREDYVEEYHLRIHALKAKGRWKEAYQTYLLAVEQVIDHPSMDKAILFEFASFLYEQGKYEECIFHCQTLAHCYADPRHPASLQQKADLNELYGLASFASNERNLAKNLLESALKIRQERVKEDPKTALDFVKTSIALARVYYSLDKHIEAEQLYLGALQTLRAQPPSQSAAKLIADATEALASLYYQINRHEDAEKLFCQALSAAKDMGKDDDYDRRIARLSHRLAALQNGLIFHQRIDRYFKAALIKRGELMKEGSAGFYSYGKILADKLADLYDDTGHSEWARAIEEQGESLQELLLLKKKTAVALAGFEDVDYSFYDRQIPFAEVEGLFQKALALRRKLVEENPEANALDEADSCVGLGFLYLLAGHFDFAEKYLLEAEMIQNRLIQIDPHSAASHLALTYSNLAFLYSLNQKPLKAERYYQKVMKAYQNVSRGKRGGYENERARTYCYLGNHYRLNQSFDRGDECYFQSIKLYFVMYQKSPKAYIDRLINTSAEIVARLLPEQAASWMKELLD